jgi:hypothetical protein
MISAWFFFYRYVVPVCTSMPLYVPVYNCIYGTYQYVRVCTTFVQGPGSCPGPGPAARRRAASGGQPSDSPGRLAMIIRAAGLALAFAAAASPASLSLRPEPLHSGWPRSDRPAAPRPASAQAIAVSDRVGLAAGPGRRVCRPSGVNWPLSAAGPSLRSRVGRAGPGRARLRLSRKAQKGPGRPGPPRPQP